MRAVFISRRGSAGVAGDAPDLRCATLPLALCCDFLVRPSFSRRTESPEAHVRGGTPRAHSRPRWQSGSHTRDIDLGMDDFVAPLLSPPRSSPTEMPAANCRGAQ